MTPERWKQIEQVLVSAWELAPSEQPVFLDQACGGDLELRAQVAALLKADRSDDGFLCDALISLPGNLEDGDSTESLAGRRVGPYEIQREIGRGGMGAVYLAERVDGQYRKKVAIKLVNSPFGGDLLRRFRLERQVVAALDHPNLAHLLDGGSTPDGLHYLVMDYIEGVRIDHWCNSRDLPVGDRLKLFLRVCAGVQYAHDQQVIHRDIKPANILVTGDGTPKLLDFGIAKVRNAGMSYESPQTTIGPGPMTPEYASPEQLLGERVGPASDIYSLGVVLYELLTGRPPYSRSCRDPAQLSRMICEAAPVKPSAAVSQSGGRPRQLSSDLDTIVLKALRKEPERRYASAAELAQDLDRHLRDLPVQARNENLLYRAQKSLKRKRPVLITAAASVFLALLLILGLQQFARQSPRATVTRSIAVLPLRNESGDPAQEPLVDNISGALIATLGKVKSLRVISRESMTRYKGLSLPASRISSDLHVEALVNGSVLRSGDRVRIHLQLNDGQTNRVLWKRTFEPGLADVPAMPNEAAKAIAMELRAALVPDEDARLSAATAVNRQAYEAYLKGCYNLNKHTVEGFQKGLQFFSDAIEIEPAYPLAWAGLADAYYEMSGLYFPAAEAMPKAKAAALKALSLDEALAEAHASLAQVQAQFEWDWNAAEKSYRRAIDLNPSYAGAHLYYSVYLAEQGQMPDAVREAEEAKRLDPLASVVANNLAWMYYLAGDSDRALASYRRILELDPRGEAAYGMGLAYVRKHMYPQAIAEFRKPLQGATRPVSPDSVENRAMIGYTFALSGKREQANTVLAELAEISRQRRVDQFYPAIIHAALGNGNAAFGDLEKSYQERSEELLMLKTDPRLDALRSDPRFAALVHRIGLPK